MDRTCSTCGAVFQFPSGLKRHAARKTPCGPAFQKKTQESAEKTFPCAHCGRAFGHASNLSEHKKKSCPALRAKPASLELPANAVLEKKIEALRQELLALRSAVVPATQIVNQDNRDQSVGTMNVQVAVINGGQGAAGQEVHNFGEEDTSAYVEVLGRLLDILPKGTAGDAVIAGVMRLIWNNPEFPENRTIQMLNKRDGVPHVKTPNGWEPRSEAEVIPRMIDRACDELCSKQDHNLGLTPSGLKKLNDRSEHVSAAFRVEAELKSPENRKIAREMIRPALYGSGARARPIMP
jgi:hypothetical protein